MNKMNKFERYSGFPTWVMALLLVALAAGCGGGSEGRDPILGVGGIATLAPTVTAVTPLPNATGVAINTRIITAAFSKAMNPATLTPASFTLACPGYVPVGAVTVTYLAAGNVATLTLPALPDLPPTIACTATVTTGATDTIGIPLASNFVWTFTTGITPDTTRPTVTLTVPANAAVGVATNTAITAVFSEDMASATITAAGTFTVTCVAPQAAACVSPVAVGAVTYVGASRTALFTPGAALSPGAIYSATITAAATDTASPSNALLVPAVLPVPNPWTFTTAVPPALDTTAPVVSSTNPANGANNVAVAQNISATFNEAMNPATITAASFTVTGPAAGLGAGPVAGLVTYDMATNIATFNPTIDLIPTVTYTATISNAATDLAVPGNALVVPAVGGLPVPNPWTFSVPAIPPVVIVPIVNLRSVLPFGAAGGAGITSCGFTVITGDVATTSASTLVTGLTDENGLGDAYTIAGCPGIVNGKIYTAPPAPGTAASAAIALQAQLDAQLAFNESAPAVMPGTSQAAELGGLTLPPGIYESATVFGITLVDLTLDAGGNPDASWVFQSPTSLTVGVNRKVILTGGARARNVFWRVGSAATINAGAEMKGTILAFSGVSMGTNATLLGRAIALVGGPVTLLDNDVTVP